MPIEDTRRNITRQGNREAENKIMEIRRRMVLACVVWLATAVIGSGCIVKRMIPAPRRSFTASDLLVKEEELPMGWASPSGAKPETDNRRPGNSMHINLYKLPEAERADITQLSAIYPSVEGAKVHFSEDIQFPGETDIEGWSFTSDIADEQQFSCYTYSNLNYPICRWLARYQEIYIQVIGRLEPERVTLEEMQTVIQTIDENVAKKLGEK